MPDDAAAVGAGPDDRTDGPPRFFLGREGRYRLRAATQCTTSPRPLSQPRTGDSDMTFIINDEG